MNQRDINKAIFLSGVAPKGYTVHHDIPGESIVCEVSSVAIGNVIVKALRERARAMPDHIPPVHTWQDKACAATRGTQFGAIIRCALERDREALPRFTGKASVTSDGYVMCNFVDRDGAARYSAFVGSFGELISNMTNLKRHLKLITAECHEFDAVIRAWVGTDWRVR